MDKNKKEKDLSKNTVLFMISSFGARIISFFLIPLYTYTLTTSEYGKVDLVVTTVQLLIPILTINIQDAVLRFTLDKNYKPEAVITVGFKIIGISTFILGIALLVINWWLEEACGGNYLLFLYISYISGAINNNLSMYLKAKDKVIILATWGIINTVVTCVVNVLLLLVLRIGVNGYMIAYVSGTIIANIGMFLMGHVYADIYTSRKEKIIIRKMLAYSTPLIANSIGWWINNVSDRYLLTFFCGTAVNGVYAVAYKIPSILSAIQAVFYNAWSVSAITEYDSDDSDGFIGSVYTVYSTMTICTCSAIMILNIFIAKILYAEFFFEAWKYVPPLLVGTVFNGLGLFNGCLFTAVKKTKDISVTTVLGATINTILNFVLIPFIGAYGAALATMIGYFSIWFIRLIRMRTIVKMRVDWKRQMVIILLLLAQCIVAMLTDKFVYQIPFVVGIVVVQHVIICKMLEKLYSIINKRNSGL